MGYPSFGWTQDIKVEAIIYIADKLEGVGNTIQKYLYLFGHKESIINVLSPKGMPVDEASNEMGWTWSSQCHTTSFIDMSVEQVHVMSQKYFILSKSDEM